MKKISEEEINQIIDMFFEKGYSVLNISKKLNISRNTISDIINKYKEENNVTEKKINKVIFRKGEIYETAYVSIPKPYVKELDITKEDREVQIVLNKEEKEIIIRKNKK